MNVSDAAYNTVHDYPGGASSLAPRFGTKSGGVMSPSVLNSKVDPKKDSHHLSLAEASKLMALTGDHRILHALAIEHGFVCVAVDDDAKPCDMAVLEAVTQVWAKNGDVGLIVNAALSDGKIDSKEVMDVKKSVYALQSALQGLVKRFEALSE